ncbi:hypothetical protein BP6252_03544 [Coleophoma cylindrospora]|uniref:FAS1 domain-containing protein n=1 Tax=Coleophoma cylindrospora TaxID=1849047 RepID=A0A3D8S7Z8_9HELO|nr:hypothetical protein BP6252_03544 [Coleophoma cylindrospora]
MHLQYLLPVALAAVAAAQNRTLAQAIAGQSSLTTFQSLLSAQPDLVRALSNASSITILAPSNDAFSKFLSTTDGKAASAQPDVVAAVLQYHVLNAEVPGSAFTTTPQFVPSLLTNSTYANVTGGQVVEGVLNGKTVEIYSGLKLKSTVTTADITFQGGVMHIIDNVLTIPPSDAVTAVDSQLTSLAGALTKANLVTAVDDLKDVTIFAPSNDAFKQIGGTAESLSTQQLTTILEYHVIKGTVGYSTLLIGGLANETLPSLSGAGLNILIEDNKVFVDSAQVTMADIIVANGVMHVIGNVLNPDNTSATPNPTATTQSVAFAGATSAANAPFTSGINPTTTAPAAGITSKAAAARQTGAIGAAALFGGAAMIAVNL